MWMESGLGGAHVEAVAGIRAQAESRPSNSTETTMCSVKHQHMIDVLDRHYDPQANI